MPSLISLVSIFPQTRIWRIRSQSQVKHSFGGLASILVFLIIGAILIVKIKQITQKKTMTVLQQKRIGIEGIVTNLTTQQNSQNQPIMVAVDTQSGLYQVKAIHYGKIANYNITFEPCTVNHFANEPRIGQVFNNFRLNQSICLPINQDYQVGGHRYSSGVQYIEIEIACSLPSQCFNTNINFLVQSYFINPNNNSQFWQPSVKIYRYKYGSSMKFVYFQFIKNTLDQDQSIFPFQSQKNLSSGYQVDSFIHTQDTNYALSGTGITLDLSISQKNNHYQVRYLTFIDALSYVGGIFNVLISIFFFVSLYGQSFVQYLIGSIYFRSKSAQSFGFFAYVKQMTFKVAKKIGFNPKWQLSEKRQQVNKAVKNIMNVINLQRRIQFLEKAISVILQSHHLKGLRLIHRLTVRQVNESHKEHGFRQRLLHYFKKKGKFKGKANNQVNQKKKKISQKTQSASNLVKGDTNKRQLNDLSLRSKSISKSQQQNLKQVYQQSQILQSTKEIVDRDLIDEDQHQPIVEDELFYEQFQHEISKELKILLQQSASRQGSALSKKIVSQIDPKIIELLRQQVAEEQKYNYRYSIGTDFV